MANILTMPDDLADALGVLSEDDTFHLAMEYAHTPVWRHPKGIEVNDKRFWPLNPLPVREMPRVVGPYKGDPKAWEK